MLVIDASAAVAASAFARGFDAFGGERLVAPPLMWSEARSALHQMMFRGVVHPDDAERTRQRIEQCPVERTEHQRLGEQAWALAEQLGWAKTYYAEYVALAQLLGCRLVTLDARLRRGADRLDIVVSPEELT